MRGRKLFVTAVASAWTLCFVASFIHGNVYGASQAASAAVVALPFVVVSLIIGLKRPENRMGILFALGASGLTTYALFADYAGLALTHHWPGVAFSAALASAVWHPAFLFLALIFLYFPTGTVRTRPLRAIRTIAVVWYSIGFAIEILWPAAPVHDHFPKQIAPWHLPGGGFGTTAYNVFLPSQLLVLFVAVVSLVVRLFRSKGLERQQLKWFTYPVVLAIASLLVSLMVFSRGILFAFTLPLVPAGATVAILRYRLYEIDRLVSRTVSYAVIFALLGGVFTAIVLLPTALLSTGHTPGWLVATATLAAAVLFGPLRRRVQGVVDRRFNRVRYDAARTIGAFTSRLRDDIDIDALSVEIRDVVTATMQPTHVNLWLSG